MNKMNNPTQLELKTAYHLVCEDMLSKLAQAKPGESIRLSSLGAFTKRKYSLVIEGQNYQGYQFSFRSFSVLKNLKYK
jgi:hypothetical protein